MLPLFHFILLSFIIVVAEQGIEIGTFWLESLAYESNQFGLNSSGELLDIFK